MRIHILSHFFRPDPVARAFSDLEEAKQNFAAAYSEHRIATDRQDTRRMGMSAAVLREANKRLIRAERAYDEARA
ncbi:hypothetical protein [Brevundimonas diminuta]|uniref:hypothetical protein n=1 Tax=Brevundimonas diminuta TaxID=293 RepID=UPI0025A5C0D2|nr:hypothetical protein [Brevundimonas diminuta]MDM8352878.1 hypothetical protein [Brevundimonas diminuta]